MYDINLIPVKIKDLSYGDKFYYSKDDIFDIGFIESIMKASKLVVVKTIDGRYTTEKYNRTVFIEKGV